VDKYESEGEKKYIFFTLDDGSGQIKLKSFGDDVDKFKAITHGQTTTVIGVLRHFNNETYIAPEIIKEMEPKYLLVRKLELEKTRSESTPPPENKEEVIAIKDKLIDKIKNSEEEGGIEIDKIIMELRETSPEIINQEVQKLISEGIVFEPRPGKLRYLG
jgi:RecG-like helicase